MCSDFDRIPPARTEPPLPSTLARQGGGEWCGHWRGRRAVLRLAGLLALAAAAMTESVTLAAARGGRSTAADCAAGSDDPDCPDTGDSSGKPPAGKSDDKGDQKQK